jgi:hypothetical protein
MAEAATTTASTAEDNAASGDDFEADTGETGADTALGDAGQRALEAERTARKEAEKARRTLERELNTLKQQGMNESERAVAEAREQGRVEASSKFAERLVRSDFATEAARRNPGFDTAGILDDLNLARFVSDDGEPDSKAIKAAVARLVPVGEQAPDFDGGGRSNAKSTDMNEIIRRAGRR